MKTAIIVSGIVLFGALLTAEWHTSIVSIRAQNAFLSNEVRQVARIQNQNRLLKGPPIDTNRLALLRGERVELMRLRSEVAEYRRAAAKTPKEVNTAIESDRLEAVAERRKADLLVQQETAKALSDKTIPLISTLTSIVRSIAKAKGEFPGSLEQANEWAQATKFAQFFKLMMTNSSPDIIPLTMFEFLPREEVMKFSEAGSKLLLRERQARAQPGGGWKRAYAYSDRKTIEVELPDGNFEAWEREHLTNKP